MNLIISLPLGVVIIAAIYLTVMKMTKATAYMLAGVMALATFAVYSFIAAVSWPGADVYAIHVAVFLLSIYALAIISGQKKSQNKIHWGPKLLIGFFALVLITNSVFVYLAQTGMSPGLAKIFLPEPKHTASAQSIFPGVVSHDFREREEQFNLYQQERLAQNRLGWQVSLGWFKKPLSGDSNKFLVRILNSEGKQLANAQVGARFLYPANTLHDKVYGLVMQDNGLYSQEIKLDRPGTWDVIINIKHADGTYEVRSKTVLN